MATRRKPPDFIGNATIERAIEAALGSDLPTAIGLPEGGIYACNDAFAALLGVPPTFVAGRRCLDFTDVKDLHNGCQLRGEVLAGTRQQAVYWKTYLPVARPPVFVRVELSAIRDAEKNKACATVARIYPVAESHYSELVADKLTRFIGSLAFAGLNNAPLPAVGCMRQVRVDDDVYRRVSRFAAEQGVREDQAAAFLVELAATWSYSAPCGGDCNGGSGK